MSSVDKNLSLFSIEGLNSIAKNSKIGVVVSEWNTEITEALFKGCLETLLSIGVLAENISRKDVPGSFELTLGVQQFAQKEDIRAVIGLGCVIQGETRHFDFICQAVAFGFTEVSLKYNKPIIFGVLTTNTFLQAQERSGGKHGNKGHEAAYTAVKMLL